MEQKRTLWIIAAVGVFLLVVLGAALILYSPKATSGQIASGHNSTKTNDSGWISLAPAQNNEVSSNQGKENPFERTRPLPPVEERRDELSSVESNRTVQYEQNQVASRENSVTHVGELTVYADKATFYTNTPSGEGNAVPQTVINNTTTIDLKEASIRLLFRQKLRAKFIRIRSLHRLQVHRFRTKMLKNRLLLL